MGSSPLVCEVEYLECDRHSTDAATDLEWIDPVIDEVAEQLRPCTLLFVRCVPDSRLARSVVTARTSGGVGAGGHRVTCGALVPVGAFERSPRCGGDRVGKLHT
ncbi:Uncharacterised protein [Mycobacterium tuberculosis]|uniref:Uncharacterized protein n=1 Tax=Mycobacterium tuberculosis TaxID=1773 RepID=A0A916LG75_MYCTX|nr:Uncharacterised protein [Mycobacterium tuberculosis]COW68363.1 Uncharacterised protein [Mycobacterium tuberculosis]COX15290.1 Uncharacterised protein [Mycobacterium tuberculosis]CPA82322.1 Uncharacterised protein [Mycobacterium tuberculosis]